MKRTVVALITGLALLTPFMADAEVKDPLLQKLMEKGALTGAEAEEVQSKKTELPAALKGLSIGGLIFLDYSAGQTGGATKTNYNRFTVQRGYINVNKEITPWFKARITPDISSAGTGNLTLRMKYVYADFLLPDLGPLTGNDLRPGLGQTPFIEFEESINIYRMQSPMFQDKRGIITSADAGISLSGNLAGTLTKEQMDEVGSTRFNGRYGTYFVGVYNGGGYGAATEANQNKTLQGRLTVRPLPDVLPGLQLTYFGISGKGNANEASTGEPQTYSNNTGFVSFQHRYAVLTAEVMGGKGTNAGDTTTAKEREGYSFYGRVAIPTYEKVAAFARFDSLDPDTNTSNDRIETTIVGVSYNIAGNSFVVAAYEKTEDETKPEDDKKGQVVLQVAF